MSFKILGTVVALIAFGAMLVVIKTLIGATPRDTVGTRKFVDRDGVTLVYSHLTSGLVASDGQGIVMVPSLGRSASDFNELALAMQAEGYDVVLVEPRGMRAKGGLDDKSITLFDLADDVAAIAADAGRAGDAGKSRHRAGHILIGHAFGNRVARAYATKYEAATQGVILLAAGGKVPLAKPIERALIRSFWTWMPDFWRRPFVRLAFFADGNKVPIYWMRGWNIATSQMQVRATFNVHSKQWWAGGKAPLMVVQGMADTIAPPKHTADLLEAEFGERVHVVRIEQAGHAILPEQPEQVVMAVRDFVDRIARPAR